MCLLITDRRIQLLSVVKGTGMVLENLKNYEAVLLQKFMRGMYSAFIKNKDHFLIIFSSFISVSLLTFNRGSCACELLLETAAARFCRFRLIKPIKWIGFLKDVEEENRVLREKILFLISASRIYG